jgi:hypothetical protein
MNIKHLLEIVNYCFESGGKYQWHCYGDDAFFIDFKTVAGKAVGGAIVNSIGEVLEAHLEVPGEPICYQWTNPAYRQSYLDEAKRRGVDPDIAWDDVEYTILEVEEDFLERFDAIIHGREFDRGILVPLHIPDDELFVLFKMAHEANMTFNDFVNQILEKELIRL